MTTTLQTMSGSAAADPAAAAFNQRVFADASGSLAVAVAGVGDALGLFRALAGHPGTAAELAGRAGVSTRFTAEWLAAMAAHGYVLHREGVFELPAAHEPALASDTSPLSVTGILAWVQAVAAQLPTIADGIRTGNGVPMARYGAAFAEAMDRFGAPLYSSTLVPRWLPAAAGGGNRAASGGPGGRRRLRGRPRGDRTG